MTIEILNINLKSKIKLNIYIILNQIAKKNLMKSQKKEAIENAITNNMIIIILLNWKILSVSHNIVLVDIFMKLFKF